MEGKFKNNVNLIQYFISISIFAFELNLIIFKVYGIVNPHLTMYDKFQPNVNRDLN